MTRRVWTEPRRTLVGITAKRAKKLGLNRELLGKVVGDAASQMSRLMTGYYADFSTDRVLHSLLSLGSDIEIRVRHRRKPRLGTTRGRLVVREVA